MSTKQFISEQRAAMKVFLVLFSTVLVGFWMHTALDQLFDLGWDSDKRVLWIAPLMAFLALAIRAFASMIFSYVEKNY